MFQSCKNAVETKAQTAAPEIESVVETQAKNFASNEETQLKSRFMGGTSSSTTGGTSGVVEGTLVSEAESKVEGSFGFGGGSLPKI